MKTAEIAVYKCQSKLMPGPLWLRFENGYLRGVEYEFKGPLLHELWQKLHAKFPRQVEDLKKWEGGTIQVKALGDPKGKATREEKIKLFCGFYQHYRGVAYQPKQLEKANIHTVKVTPKLLHTFFNSPLQNFTMANYIERINITTDQARNGHQGSKHPIYYDSAYERTLKGTDITDYHAHLIKLGWKKNNSPGGGTTWQRPQQK